MEYPLFWKKKVLKKKLDTKINKKLIFKINSKAGIN